MQQPVILFLLISFCYYFTFAWFTQPFTAITATWTWMSGSQFPSEPARYGERLNASTDNVPGARIGAAGYFDSNAKELWIFGGASVGGNFAFLTFSIFYF